MCTCVCWAACVCERGTWGGEQALSQGPGLGPCSPSTEGEAWQWRELWRLKQQWPRYREVPKESAAHRAPRAALQASLSSARSGSLP